MLVQDIEFILTCEKKRRIFCESIKSFSIFDELKDGTTLKLGLMPDSLEVPIDQNLKILLSYLETNID